MQGGIIVIAKHKQERLAKKGVFVAIIDKKIDPTLFSLSCMFIDNYTLTPQTDIRVADTTLFQLGKGKGKEKRLQCNVNTRDHSLETLLRLKNALQYLANAKIFPMEITNKRPFIRVNLFLGDEILNDIKLERERLGGKPGQIAQALRLHLAKSSVKILLDSNYGY